MKRNPNSLYCKVLATALTKQQYADIKQLAEDEAQTISTYLRRLIVKDLKQHGLQKLSTKPPRDGE